MYNYRTSGTEKKTPATSTTKTWMGGGESWIAQTEDPAVVVITGVGDLVCHTDFLAVECETSKCDFLVADDSTRYASAVFDTECLIRNMAKRRRDIVGLAVCTILLREDRVICLIKTLKPSFSNPSVGASSVQEQQKVLVADCDWSLENSAPRRVCSIHRYRDP
jgi:hypothetical protein